MSNDKLLTEIYRITYESFTPPADKLDRIQNLVYDHKKEKRMKWETDEVLELYTHGAISGIADDNHYRE